MEKPVPGIDFVNPYIDVPDENIKRTNTEIDVNDWNLLRSVRVQQGTFTTANNLLIWKLCNECRRRGFTDMSQHKEFERFVAGLHLVPDDEYRAAFVHYPAGSGVLDSTTNGTGGKDNGPATHRGTAREGRGATQPSASAARVHSTKGEKDQRRSRGAKGK